MRVLGPFAVALLAGLAASACGSHGSGGAGGAPPPPTTTPPPAGDPLDPKWMPAVDTDPSHYPANVWVTDAMAKVVMTDTAGPLHWALLSAAKNETESFQVHVHADTAVAGFSVEVSDLHDATGGGTILAATNITVSRELYLDIAQPTGAAPSAALVSDLNGISGKVPDALIPNRDVMFGEARNAFPFDVAAANNASAWVDVFVPKDAASGWYTGTTTVKSGGNVIATLPIRLKVWNVALPSTATYRTHFGMSDTGVCRQHYGGTVGCGKAVGGTDAAGLEYLKNLYATFALNHRISIGDLVSQGPNGDDWSHFDATYAPFMNGTASTQLAGAKLTSLHYSDDPADPTHLAAWATHFKAQGWMDQLIYYHCDEPGGSAGCTYDDAIAEENVVHTASPDFSTLLTTSIRKALDNPGLLDSVDILTPSVTDYQPHDHPASRSAYDPFLTRSPRKHLYWYQSCDAHESCDVAGIPGGTTSTWPSYMADAAPMRNRVFQWLAYLNRIEGELYYVTDLCFEQACGRGAVPTTDPFVSIYAFSGNGDGTLFYPGKPAVIGGSHDIPLSSIRLELIREGMEDYELLHMLDAQGDKDFATAQVSSFVRAASDFDSDPSHLMAAREAMGDRLHAKTIAKP